MNMLRRAVLTAFLVAIGTHETGYAGKIIEFMHNNFF